jgi:hypothetical protein
MPVFNSEGTWVGDFPQVVTNVGADSVVTLAAPGERMRWLITGLSATTDKIPTAPAPLTIVSGATTIERIEGNNAWPWNFAQDVHYRGGVNEAVVITLTTQGAAVRGTLRITAMKVSA